MAETSAPDPKSRKPLWSRPIGRVAFWVCGAIAVVAFGAAVVAAGEDGWQGFVYLSGLAAVGFLVLYAIAAGETAGRNLRRKIEKNRAPTPAALAFRAIETFPEPVLISDRRGAPRWGNAAYHALARKAGGFGQSFGLPTIDRLWAGAGGGDGTVYRLARAAARGVHRTPD